MVVNRSRPTGVIPTLYYEDVASAIAWLCGAFGFRERFRYGPPDDTAGAQLDAGDGIVMLGRARRGQSAEWDDGLVLGPPAGITSVVVSVRVVDIDAHHERAKTFGARIVHEPETYHFGERQYSAEDLEGHRWTFSESVEDVAPETWGATVGA